MDWAKITAQVEHALTLDAESFEQYIDTIENSPESLQVTRLLKLSQPANDFLATSAPGEQADKYTLQKGTSIGPWEIDELVGRGGMGDVYKAHRADGLYEQIVALKLIQNLSHKRGDLFEVERRRLAMMDHPGIARIIDGGTSDDGLPYMAMEFVDGTPITQHADTFNLNRRQRLLLFTKVCNAVEHAHANLVLHRDIKPNNVLVAKDGLPRLIDFGIAIAIDDDTGVTSALSLTSAAPEQLKGEPISMQTDIFALGVLLHQMLTGERPVRLASGGMKANAEKLSNQDLQAIISKTLSLEPHNRYDSVTKLKDDVTAFIQTRPVVARNGGWRYQFTKFLQRNPLPNALAAIAIVSLFSGLGFSMKFANEAQLEASRANNALEEAETNLARARFFLERADLFHATQSAYADSLQSMFGGEADVKRQTDVLKQRWEQAYELREQDPNNAAFLSYAIGRHFLFRNDYITAIEILRPWAEEAYGPKTLVGYAKQLLAVAYMSAGKEQEALPMLRETEQWLASSFDAQSPDHIASATQIAILTKAEDDILLAEDLLLKGLEVEQNAQIKMYFYNQLSKMRQMRSDFDSAYDAMKQVVSIIDATPLMDISGTDTGYLNLANFEFWYTKDHDEAELLANKVVKTAEKKGESRELGLAQALLANIKAARGNSEQALADINSALKLSEQYAGKESESTVRIALNRAEILADMQKTEARDLLNALTNTHSANPNDTMYQRFQLADIYITLKLYGQEQAQARYDALNLEPDIIASNIELSYLRDRLEQNGIAI